MKYPPWFVMQPLVTEENLLVEDFEQIVEIRIKLLLSQSKNIMPSRFALENDDFKINSIKGNTLMKIGVCMDPRMSSWLVEKEGDLFEKYFRQAKWNEKETVITHLFGEKGINWSDLTELKIMLNEPNLEKELHIKQRSHVRKYSKYGGPKIKVADAKGLNKIIAIHYKYAPYLVKHRKVLLYKGWALAEVDRLVTTIKHRYEYFINNSLTEFAERIETQSGGNVKLLSKKIHEFLRKEITFSKNYDLFDSLVITGDFEDNVSIYPPCISDLVTAVNNIGYIGHWERFQLGIFLKKTGMGSEEQMQFWFSKAVDNVDMNYQDFKRKAGYIIRHIYGKEGGMIDYEMPSCNTIMSKMYCTFRHKDINFINEKVKHEVERFEKNKEIKLDIGKKVVEASIRVFPQIACAYFLELSNGVKTDKIFHPLMYLKMAGQQSGVVVDKTDEKLDPAKNKSDSKTEEAEVKSGESRDKTEEK